MVQDGQSLYLNFTMCTGVVNVSSTAWLGMALISIMSEKTTNLKAMSPKQLKYCSHGC